MLLNQIWVENIKNAIIFAVNSWQKYNDIIGKQVFQHTIINDSTSDVCMRTICLKRLQNTYMQRQPSRRLTENGGPFSYD